MNLSLNFLTEFSKEHYQYGARTDGETHGVVLTKPHVVELILDLAGYTADKDLANLRLLEPSCGTGAFLVPAVRRLLTSFSKTDRPLTDLGNALRAFDIDTSHVAATKAATIEAILQFEYSRSAAETLADAWIHEADFLLVEIDAAFDYVVGNPPYIRIEQLSPRIQTEYRRRYNSLFDRADLYVAFIERSLKLLGEAGMVAFICADRWILNRYGAPLRKFISSRHKVVTYIDLHTAFPFESDVIAYPSIFVIGAGKQAGVDVFTMSTANPSECQSLRSSLEGDESRREGLSHSHYETWFDGDEPWTLSSPEQLAALRALENRFASIESDGETRVGIGVATGRDATYIVTRDANIEAERLVPLVMRADLQQGKIKDSGRYVINTFEDNGDTIELTKYPLLKAYFADHADAIRCRHVAKKNSRSWFRTIDRVYPELVSKPKLLIPDIAGANEVTFDCGQYHPHHNLYFVVSQSWDLEVLGGLLSSQVALFFVWSYATKMRGGYLRFQAQYLRRIRVPQPHSINAILAGKIKAAFRERDFPLLDNLSLRAYGLDGLPAFDFIDTRK